MKKNVLIFTGITLVMLSLLTGLNSCNPNCPNPTTVHDTLYVHDTTHMHDTANCVNCYNAVACYPFNGNADDVSGNAYNGTVHNASLATDRKGNANSCYFFTGYNAGNPDYIELPTLQSINNTNEISISIWLKADQTNPGGPTPFTLMPDNSSDRLNAHINYAPYTLYWDNGNISSAGRVYTNYTASYAWDHFVFIKSTTNNKMQVYKNNVLIIDANQHSDISNKNRNIRIGGGAGGNQYFTGWIDDLKIFNRALTATEVNQIYNAER